jgi:hypothetical protein
MCELCPLSHILTYRAAFCTDTDQILPNRYVNFATGDEKKEELYGGENLEKLQELKRKWDENGHFDHFNPIC